MTLSPRIMMGSSASLWVGVAMTASPANNDGFIFIATGGDGNDSFTSNGTGSETVTASGGDGNDSFHVNNGGMIRDIFGGAGEDQVIVNGATTHIDVGADNDTVRIGPNGTVGDIAIGNDGDADLINLGRIDQTLCLGRPNPYSGAVADPTADQSFVKNGNTITFNTFEFLEVGLTPKVCPGLNDKDLDGVRDDVDDCPLTPGNYEDGCAYGQEETRCDELCHGIPQLGWAFD